MSAQGLFSASAVNRDLAALAPGFRKAVEAAIAECHGKGLDAWIFEGHRSESLQALYYQRGRTVIPPKLPVTNARSSLHSWHGYGLAVDVVSKKHLWNPPGGDAWFKEVAVIFERHNCRWGGHWKNRDLPHFQWGRCKPSPSDRARLILLERGVQAVWREVGAQDDAPVVAAAAAPAAAALKPAAAAGHLPLLKRGHKGDAVIELQMRLAGFRGTVPDGDFGPGTELQVMSFQRDFMKLPSPTGELDAPTIAAIDDFAAKYPVNFKQLSCVCGTCGGFGRGRDKGVYRYNSRREAHHRYEYPGIHRMLLWTYRAATFYVAGMGWKLRVNSGYRCSEDNRRNRRTTTNHHGKAIDIDILGTGGTDAERCNRLRGILVERANAQISWSAGNRKSLEPADIAPTWVHLDVREYELRYLEDRYFVKDAAQLDRMPA